MEALDLGRDPLRLFDLLFEPVGLDRSVLASGDDLACGAGKLVGGHPYCGVQNRLRDPMRRGEHDACGRLAAGVWELFWEPGHVLQLGPAEAVDRLVRVGCRSDIAMTPGETLQERCLGVCGVLVLVDEHVAVLAIESVHHLVVGNQGGSFGEQRAVVDGQPIAKGVVVSFEKRSEAAPVVAIEFGEIVGLDELLTTAEHEVGHLVGEGAGVQEAAVGVGPCRRVLFGQEKGDEPFLVGPRQHLGCRIPSTEGGVCLEQAAGEGVVGGDVDRRHRAGDGFADPAVEVGGTATREGDDEEVAAVSGIDERPGPPHQELGLARPRATHDELGTVGVGDVRGPFIRRDADFCFRSHENGSGGSWRRVEPSPRMWITSTPRSWRAAPTMVER